MKRLLLIEDEAVILRALARLLERNRYAVRTVRDVDAACAEDPRGFDLILADLRLPGRDGTAIIPLAEPVPVVIMTSHASVRSAVEAMRAGAADYIAKPFDHAELLLVLQRALRQNLVGTTRRALARDLERVLPAARHVLGTSLERLLERHVADDAPLHLRGERGSGGEALARMLHARGTRHEAPLVLVEPAALEPARAAAALFGDERASAAAAATDLPSGGLVRDARGGTLVLRDPERLCPALQGVLAARLLRDGDGSGRTEPRLITLSRHGIDALAPALAAVLGDREQTLLPLAERPGDVVLVARRAARSVGLRHGGRAATLGGDAEAMLAARRWSGNLAELETAVASAVLRALARDDDPSPVLDAALFDPAPAPPVLDLDGYFRYAVTRLQRRGLSETEIARALGISRKALWERRRRMTLPRPAEGDGEGDGVRAKEDVRSRLARR